MSPEVRSRASQPLGSTATHYYPLTAFKPSLPISHLEAGHDGTHLETPELEVGGSLEFWGWGEGEIRRRSPQRLSPSQGLENRHHHLGKFIYHLTDFTASPAPMKTPMVRETAKVCRIAGCLFFPTSSMKLLFTAHTQEVQNI